MQRPILFRITETSLPRIDMVMSSFGFADIVSAICFPTAADVDLTEETIPESPSLIEAPACDKDGLF